MQKQGLVEIRIRTPYTKGGFLPTNKSAAGHPHQIISIFMQISPSTSQHVKPNVAGQPFKDNSGPLNRESCPVSLLFPTSDSED